MPRIIPPKPRSRPDDASIWERIKLFRADIFRSQPERLYGAQVARIKTPLYSSFLINQPDIVRRILEERPDDFPKASLVADTLRPLLGNSVFVTNGVAWKAQRRVIDPAFEAGRLRETFGAMREAAQDAVDRLETGERDVEFLTAHLAADVIFRTLFSIPITQDRARDVFDAFRDYQRQQPLLSPLDLIKAPKWIPRRQRGNTSAGKIRALLSALVEERRAEIKSGRAPDDLATKIMTTTDPETSKQFTKDEMVDQVAIFFLAGHETSASALSWALYCLACDKEAQDNVVAEVRACRADAPIEFSDVSKLRFTRDVFREVLRLYPPVPMMVRETRMHEEFRDMKAQPGSMCILSPWHLQRHSKIWERPDVFDPWRWQDEKTRHCARDAYLPFSKGPRVCTGAGFAMLEGVLSLAMLIRKFEFAPFETAPVPVAHLTVRSENGIRLKISARSND